LHAPLQAQSEQKLIKNFGKSSPGHSQGLPKIFRALIHRAHSVVIFAITQLSCYLSPSIVLSVQVTMENGGVSVLYWRYEGKRSQK